MAISDDFSLNYGTKKISHTSGSSRYTVNALYSHLMNLFDDAGQMDDTVPMKANTPTEYELINGWTFNADSDVGYLSGGSIKVNQTDDLWANLYTLGTIESDGVVYWYQNGSLVSAHPGYTTGHIDQLIKVRASGSDIDSRKVTAFIRNNASSNADLYDHFELQTPTTGGRNPVPLASSPDTNDDGSGASYTGVTITFGSTNQDIGDGGGAQPYDVTVDGGGTTCANVYKRLKYLTRRENTSDIGNGVNGRFYRAASGSYAEVKAAPFGTFAGGKFFGARGVWLTNVSDPNNRQLLDANNVSRVPPVQMTVTVNSVAVGDRVLVARASGGAIIKDQFNLDGAHNGGTTITVKEAIGNDIPSSGVIRVGDDRYTYSGLTRGSKQFTGCSPTVGSYSDGQDAYVPLIDDAASSTSIASPAMTYVSDFDVLARVRKYGILPFEIGGTVTSSGASISAIRTTDSIVS